MALRLKSIAAVTVASLLATGCATVIVPGDDARYFPMRRGARWTYETHSEVCQTGGGIATNDFTVSCEVLKTWTRGTVTAARLRGFPLAMDVWGACTNSNDSSLLVCIPGSQYHLLDATDAERFVDANDFLFGLVSEDTLFLDCPLVGGKRFGEYEQLTRPDLFYSWRVESEERRRVRGVEGVFAWRPRIVYTLAYRTLPDSQRVVFVAGIGITEYVYHHNGTPCDVRMRLKAYKNGER